MVMFVAGLSALTGGDSEAWASLSGVPSAVSGQYIILAHYYFSRAPKFRQICTVKHS